MSTITRTIEIKAPVAQVWQEVVCRTDRMNEWMPHVLESRLLTDVPDQVGSQAYYRTELLGIQREVTNELTEVREGEYLAYRAVAGNVKDKGFWRFEADGDRTRLTFCMAYELPGAILGRIADALVFHRALEDKIAEGLHNLKRRCESGVQPLAA